VTRDGLPLIGAGPGAEGAYVATGHSVWGILNAPATGEALAELILDGRTSEVDLSPFRPDRLQVEDLKLASVLTKPSTSRASKVAARRAAGRARSWLTVAFPLHRRPSSFRLARQHPRRTRHKPQGGTSMPAVRTAPIALSAALLAPTIGLAEGVLDRLRDTGEIRIGYRADAQPLSFADEAGIASGYTVAVCDAVVEALAEAVDREALETAFMPLDGPDRLGAVANGEVDLFCGAETVTLARRASVDFSIPVFADGAAILIRRDSEPTLEALAGERVGVRSGTTTEEVVGATLEAVEVEAEIVAFDDHEAGRDALLAGEIAAYFADQSILIALVVEAGPDGGLTFSDDTLTFEKQALALPLGDSAFRLAVDTALSDLYRNGEMGRIFAETLPGFEPGLAIQTLFLVAPETP
jgi:polar amino acid transport system substrate-binding protein